MIITLSRSGGFTGITVKKTVDTKNLNPEKTNEIKDLILKSDIFSFTSSSEKPKTDRFIYTISIQNDTVFRTFDISEDSLSSSLQKVVEYLEGLT